MLNWLFIPRRTSSNTPSNTPNPDDVTAFGSGLNYLYNEGNLCSIPWAIKRQSRVTVSFDSTEISMSAQSGIKCGCVSTDTLISLANYHKLVMYCKCAVGASNGFTYMVTALCNNSAWYPGSSDSYLYHRSQSNNEVRIGHTGTFDWNYIEMDLTQTPMEHVSSCPSQAYINLALYSTSSAGTAYIKRVFLVP